MEHEGKWLWAAGRRYRKEGSNTVLWFHLIINKSKRHRKRCAARSKVQSQSWFPSIPCLRRHVQLAATLVSSWPGTRYGLVRYNRPQLILRWRGRLFVHLLPFGNSLLLFVHSIVINQWTPMNKLRLIDSICVWIIWIAVQSRYSGLSQSGRGSKQKARWQSRDLISSGDFELQANKVNRNL